MASDEGGVMSKAARYAHSQSRRLDEDVEAFKHIDGLKTGPSSNAQGPSETNEIDASHEHEGIDNLQSHPGKPTLEKSWEVFMKEVSSLDDGLVSGWKEDIDTLLVFAGLFSAVVTAFIVESYQWLEEAPKNTTVALLRQISQQLDNAMMISPTQNFEASPSVIRINVLWFLSLIIALVDALFALLCKQWLREHRQQTHTRTPSEALALRWLRKQSLKKWHVHTILASLPILLEVAVFLFLAGLLELLRDRHELLFAIAMVVAGLVALFYLGATMIPSVDIIRQVLQVTPDIRNFRLDPREVSSSPVKFIMNLPPMEYICPYKSPQAWATFQAIKIVCSLPGFVRVCYFLCNKQYLPSSERPAYKSSTWAFRDTMNNLTNWSAIDLETLQRHNVANFTPPFYELNAFRWLVAEFRDSPTMIPHLQNILKTMPPHLVMPAVLDQWLFLPHRDWTTDDIDAVLPHVIGKMEGSIRYRRETFLGPRRETTLFNRLLHFTHRSYIVHALHKSAPKEFRSLGFPAHNLDRMCVDDPIPSDLGAALSTVLIPEVGKSVSTDIEQWRTLMHELASYIIASSPNYALHIPTAATTSPFVGSSPGLDFLSKMHIKVLETQKTSRHYMSPEDDVIWIKAMDIVRRVHSLPEDHFKPLPDYFPMSLPKLEETLGGLLLEAARSQDSEYLASFSRHWADADQWQKRKLVKILSNHILQVANKASKPIYSLNTSVSPLVSSPSGLQLIAFVNDRLGQERVIYEILHRENQIAWQNTIKRAQMARPDLPTDYFRPIFHRGIGPVTSGDHDHHSQQAMNLSTLGHNTGNMDHHHQTGTSGSSNLTPSPEPPGDPKAPMVGVGNADEDEAITMRPLVVTSGEIEGNHVPIKLKEMGGPGADEKV
ncbi:hypothetical protein PQX77_008783 [Marasmius sp. AFHP31]|nr:hypothetical protein PQX77_008783 [Marasmius sp. AFHP31]